MLYYVVFIGFNLYMYKNLRLFKLSLLNFFILIFYIFFFYFNNRVNNNENVFWYIVEILNNNNKSILLYLLLILIFFQVIFNLNNLSVSFYKFLFLLFTLFFIFLYKIGTSSFIFNDFKINTNLINGVVLIHPILVYFTYIILTCFIFSFYCNKKIINNTIFFLKKYKIILFIISLFALCLGGWWAQQELNWGGWWNWDFVEIIALIFNVVSLYIIHFNFYKHLNLFNNVNKNIVYYLIIFFLFVRMDVLNSIHSFNSFSVLNNFNKFLVMFIYSFIYLIFKSSFDFFKKFYKNKNKDYTVIFIFFKSINLFFLIYFFLNLYFVIYLNYQFIDITRYLKTLLLIILFLTLLMEFSYISMIILLLLIFFYDYTTLFNIVMYFNILVFFKNCTYSSFTKLTLITHLMFVIFFINTIFNSNCFFKDISNLININYSLIVSELFHKYNYESFILNDFKLFKIPLSNYEYNTNYNSFYYKSNIYLNNILVNNNLNIYYNVDNTLWLVLYKFYIFFYLLFILLIMI